MSVPFAFLGNSAILDLVAQGIHLPREHQEIQFIDGLVVLNSLGGGLDEIGVLYLASLQFLVRLENVVLPLELTLIERLGHLSNCMDMRLEVSRRGEFKQVGVEGWHLWLNVVEQVCLLHVRT